MRMDKDDARTIERPEVRIGGFYIFFSTMVEGETDNKKLLRTYTGQRVLVEEFVPGDQADYFDGVEHLWKVRASDGETFSANTGELDGWFRDTGQYVLPDGNYYEEPATA